MTNSRKPIGVCLSQAHTFLKTDFLSELDKVARREGYGIVVFNSSMDYYWEQSGSNISGRVFELLRYDKLSALVILAGDLHDTQMQEKIIHNANISKIPVIWQGGAHNGCIGIQTDYEEAYKSIIRHVIRDHKATDTFFLAGIPDEINSKLRLRYWREVLTEEGLPCGEDRVAYGNYLESEAAHITENTILKRENMPRAVFCANDGMAAAVCDTFTAHGIRVPEDVIVTGFDGTPTAYLTKPGITTCDSDYKGQAELIIEEINRFYENGEAEAVRVHPFRPVLSGSCGCPEAINEHILSLHSRQKSEMQYNIENAMFYQVDQMMVEKELYSFLSRLGQFILPGSALYMNKSILNINPDTEYHIDHPEDKLIMVPHCNRGEQPALCQVYLKDMPLPSDKAGVTILNIVHAGERVCGYYAAHSDDLVADFRLIKRISDILNLIASVQLGRVWQRQLEAKLENNLYTDFIAGLPNLKGLSRWYDEFAADEAQHDRAVALTVYGIPNYSSCYETCGLAVTEEIVKTIAGALRSADPNAEQIARISEDQFVVIDSADDEEKLEALVRKTSETFFRAISDYNAEKIRSWLLEVNFGYTKLARGWSGIQLENLIHLAVGEMYLNRLRDSASGLTRREQNVSGLYSSFAQLMEHDLFLFYFQPIVDVRTSTIYAYEALMRTAPPVKLNPMEILTIAREAGRLYEVDKMTIFGIMERYVRENDAFRGRKVFINTIPGHVLSEEDCSELIEKYRDYLDCFVFELLEDSPTSDEELARLKRICKAGGQTQIAIDDYGTGHSNIINLLRYTPQIIKIDRGLITGIESDHNRRLFVQNTIDFAHQNGIKALAEGVETLEELNTVIECGIDLIQGFYTGRPAEMPLADISDDVRNKMVEANLQINRYDKQAKIYFAQDGEEVSLLDLALQRYTALMLRHGSYTLNGEASHNIDFAIYCADGANARLTVNNINIKGIEEPTIRLGDRSRLELVLGGKNTLDKEGILVPASASLTIKGDGDLHINNTRNYAVGIGSSYNDPYGTIRIETNGTISIQASGEKILCLGGGRSAGEGIHVLGGKLDIVGHGVSVVCFGSYDGAANISVRDTEVNVHGNGNEVLLVGSHSGVAKINVENSNVDLSAACEILTAFGTMNGSADAVISGCTVKSDTHCDKGAVFGSYGGEASICFRDSKVRLYGEGYRVSGFGSMNGKCVTKVESGEVDGSLLAVEILLLENEHSRFVVTGGNIHLAQESDHTPVSPAGTPLCFANPSKDHYESTFRDGDEEWTYKADRREDDYLGVWILL